MDAVKYAKNFSRLCGTTVCNRCPVRKAINGRICSRESLAEHAEAVVAAVEEWAAEHPQKTYLTDFLEKHPDAPLSSDGEPDACARCCGYRKDCPGQSGCDCRKCWNTPMEETK